jgi:hypothetical protein
MSKPRYDEEKDESRHAAVDRNNCQEMARRNGWQLVDVEELPQSKNPIFAVDCVFKGKTEFPKDFNETERDDD